MLDAEPRGSHDSRMKLPYNPIAVCGAELTANERNRLAEIKAWEKRVQAALALDDLCPADRERYAKTMATHAMIARMRARDLPPAIILRCLQGDHGSNDGPVCTHCGGSVADE